MPSCLPIDSEDSDRSLSCRVSPFGYLRIVAYLRLPAAFRSWSRPSSANGAMASTLCSSLLDFFYPETILSSPAFSPSGYFTFDWSSRKTHFSSVQLSRFGAPFCRRLQGNPENDTASKFQTTALCFSHFLQSPLGDRSTLGPSSGFRLLTSP